LQGAQKANNTDALIKDKEIKDMLTLIFSQKGMKPMQSELDRIKIESKQHMVRFKEQTGKKDQKIRITKESESTEYGTESSLKMTSQFRDYEKLANRLNKMYENKEITWKSEVSEIFKDLSLEELNLLAGLNNYNQKV